MEVRGIAYRMTQTSRTVPRPKTTLTGYPSLAVPSRTGGSRSSLATASKARNRIARPLMMRPAQSLFPEAAALRASVASIDFPLSAITSMRAVSLSGRKPGFRAVLTGPEPRFSMATNQGARDRHAPGSFSAKGEETSRRQQLASREFCVASAVEKGPSSFLELVEIEVGNDQQAQENQRIDDEQDADPRIASGKMSDAGRDQGDPEPKIGELLDLGGDAGHQQRQNSQCLGHRDLRPEVVGQSQMDESPLRKRKAVDEGEVDDAEHHDGTYDRRGGPVDDSIPSRSQAPGRVRVGALDGLCRRDHVTVPPDIRLYGIDIV